MPHTRRLCFFEYAETGQRFVCPSVFSLSLECQISRRYNHVLSEFSCISFTPGYLVSSRYGIWTRGEEVYGGPNVSSWSVDPIDQIIIKRHSLCTLWAFTAFLVLWLSGSGPNQEENVRVQCRLIVPVPRCIAITMQSYYFHSAVLIVLRLSISLSWANLIPGSYVCCIVHGTSWHRDLW